MIISVFWSASYPFRVSTLFQTQCLNHQRADAIVFTFLWYSTAGLFRYGLFLFFTFPDGLPHPIIGSFSYIL